jgi:hypothetical protein
VDYLVCAESLHNLLYGQYQWWGGDVCFIGHGGGERGCYIAWYWKGLPTRTLAFERQKCAHRHKSSKERLVVMCSGNATRSHKLKLEVIGKAKKPKSFKDNETNCIPVHYYNQKGA